MPSGQWRILSSQPGYTSTHARDGRGHPSPRSVSFRKHHQWHRVKRKLLCHHGSSSTEGGSSTNRPDRFPQRLLCQPHPHEVLAFVLTRYYQQATRGRRLPDRPLPNWPTERPRHHSSLAMRQGPRCRRRDRRRRRLCRRNPATRACQNPRCQRRKSLPSTSASVSKSPGTLVPVPRRPANRPHRSSPASSWAHSRRRADQRSRATYRCRPALSATHRCRRTRSPAGSPRTARAM